MPYVNDWVHENGLIVYLACNGTVVVDRIGTAVMTVAIISIGSFGLKKRKKDAQRILLTCNQSKPIILDQNPIDKFSSSIGDILVVIPVAFEVYFKELSFGKRTTVDEIKTDLLKACIVAGMRPFFVLSKVKKPLQ